MYKIKYVSMILVLIMIISCFQMFSIPASQPNTSESPEDNVCCNGLVFSSSKDVSSLGLHGFSPLSAKITINHQIETKECELIKGCGYDYLKVGNLEPSMKPGEPELPVKSFVISIPKETCNIKVCAVGGKYRDITNELNIKPTPEPKMLNHSSYVFNREVKKDEKVYNLSSFFPGKIVSYTTGEDKENKYVYIKFYPVQYIPKEEKVVLITDVNIGIDYESTKSSESSKLSKGVIDSECIIITDSSLYNEAKKLADFHKLNESITTTVVNTTWIYDNYPDASDPPYPGYKNSSLPHWGDIHNYNYSLAKKIISFLNDSASLPNLKYVVIFGNALLVPPSYYWYDEEYYYGYYYDYYNYWIPTDIFYASPDYDLTPNYEIGRISINASNNEYDFAVNKIKSWYENASYDWFKNISIIGGNTFDSWLFYGELSTTHFINQDLLNGLDITKYYLTDGNNTPEKVKTVYTKESGFLWHQAHGSGDEMADHAIDGSWMDQITTENLTNLPPNSKTPIVLSISCMNGAFDPNLMVNNLYGYNQQYSFGMGILNSSAGGIAYVGGSRTNFGGYSLHLENGTVIIDSIRYIDKMLSYVMKAYHNGGETLGNITTNALKEYLTNENMDDWANNRTVFAHTLLGDPALKIPQHQSGKSYDKPVMNITNPARIYNNVPIIGLNETRIDCSTNSSNVKMKIINPNWTTQKTENSTTENLTCFSFTPEQQGSLCVRCITDDEKETWVYAAPQKPGKILIIDLFSDIGKRGGYYGWYYENALEHNNYPYTYWDYYLLGLPDNNTADNYSAIVWFTANGYVVYSEETTWIKNYLDRGGRLFITGQDIGFYAYYYDYYYPGWYNWYKTYLHASFDYDWNAISEDIVGVSGDPIGDGLSFTITQNLYYLYPDEIGAIAPATPVFNYISNNGGSSSIYSAGVKYAGNNKTVYLGFPFETISDETTRNTIMERTMRWLVPPDLTLTSSEIFFNNSEPVNNTEITINATIHNLGAGNLSGVVIQFWDGELETGSRIGDKEYADVKEYCETYGTLTDFANMTSWTDGGAYANLSEKNIPSSSETGNAVANATGGSDTTTDALADLQVDDVSGASPSAVVTDDGWYTVDKGYIMFVGGFDTSVMTGSVSAVTLWVQFSVEAGYTGTNPIQWALDAQALSSTGIIPVDGDVDRTASYNLYAQGVDTIAKISTLDVEFTSNDGGGPTAVSFDYVWVTVTYSGSVVNYQMEIQANVTSIPADGEPYELEIYAKTTGEQFNVCIYNGSEWNAKGKITSASMDLFNYTLLQNEIIGGKVLVRFIDANRTNDNSLDLLYIDYLRVEFVQGQKIGLSPWGYENAIVTWNASPLGTHDIYVVIDPGNTTSESNETNNNASKSITVFDTFTFNLSTGWNLITPPVIKSGYRAGDLANNIPNCTHVANWSNGMILFSKSTGENNFTVTGGYGYFVYVANNTTFSLTGNVVKNVQMNLAKGWNNIGWFNDTKINASDLASSVGNCTAVAYWNNTLGRFIVHPVNSSISDFTVEKGKGYFVYLTEETVWMNK
ncbi:MAG: C25 family cysteine peptidase [Thermoplasmatales archaeon]|nr:C25 family cysteine peptidase [Thermoplasmatales archaeon]